MLYYKKICVVLGLILFMLIGVAATRPADRPAENRPIENKHKRNLKVLPKDISDDDLDKVMDHWKAALGVKCSFCHAPSKDTASRHLDFSSDAKPEKDIARHMFRMTAKINKKYFSFNKDDKGAIIPAVSCTTCHRGSAHPETN
ncbi:c-type cytochrome [Flavitalea flava]